LIPKSIAVRFGFQSKIVISSAPIFLFK